MGAGQAQFSDCLTNLTNGHLMGDGYLLEKTEKLKWTTESVSFKSRVVSFVANLFRTLTHKLAPSTVA